MRKLLTAALASLCAAGLAGAVGASTAQAAPVGCTGTVQTTTLAFNPPAISPGQSSTLTLTVQNCTDQPQQVTGYVLPTYPGSAVPCGANDPYPLQMSLTPGGNYTTSIRWDIFSGCKASALHVTVMINGANGSTPAGSADLVITGNASPPPATCAVSYANSSAWSTGFVAQVTVTNTGSSTTVNGWSLVFSYPGDQRVVTAWNATVQQSGAVVTAVNAAWDATIAPGNSVSFGVYGSRQTSDAAPTTFTLNGSPCQAR